VAFLFETIGDDSSIPLSVCVSGSSWHVHDVFARRSLSNAHIQTIIDHLAKKSPEAKRLKPNDFIDSSILKEIEESGVWKIVRQVVQSLVAVINPGVRINA
jgi:hypothetical protein